MDVVIIGGGVIGSAIAYFLTADPDFKGTAMVLEPKPDYASASTSLSVGGYRQQFSVAANIRMSHFSIDFLRRAPELLAVDGEPVDLGMHQTGYLFLAGAGGKHILADNIALQKAEGVDVAMLDPDQLTAQFPWLNVDGIAAGGLGVNEGRLDPYSLLRALRAKAIAQGAVYHPAEAVGFAVEGGRVTKLITDDDERFFPATVINAAGAQAGQVAAMIGARLPVSPRKRIVYNVHLEDGPDEMPLMIDPSGVYACKEGDTYLCGVSPPADQDPDTTDLSIDERLFNEIVWPTLAHRIPAFEKLKTGKHWAGLYAYNTLDQNAILGPHPEVDNFYFANGFSGHGLQQSPAVGRALSELIIHGAYKTLDLSCFSYERIQNDQPLRERNVI